MSVGSSVLRRGTAPPLMAFGAFAAVDTSYAFGRAGVRSE